MATHDYIISNGTGSVIRADINNALSAIVSNNSSSSEPATKYAYMWWADTSAGLLKIRNSANDAWITLFQLDGTLTLEDGSNSAPAISFRDDTNTGIFSSAADNLDITTGGTTRVNVSSTGINVTGTVIDDGATHDGDVTFTGASANIIFDKSDNNLEFADNAKATFGNNQDLEIYHDSAHSYIDNALNDLFIRNTSDDIIIQAQDDFFIRVAGGENAVVALDNGAVELYHNNVKRCETSADGLDLPDNSKLQVGSSQDLKVYHDSTNSFIQKGDGTGSLFIDANGINFRGANGETLASFVENGSVELYEDNVKRFETTTFGCTVQGGITFGSDTAAANQLDDYEEGVFTPSLEFGGATTGITYSSMRGGSYVKIGRQVTVNFGFTLTSKGSASGDATIAGLPFAVEDLLSSTSVEASGISSFWNDIATDSANIVFAALGGTSELELRNTVGAEDDTDAMDNGDFDNDTAIRGSITYFTAT
tara:strand:- start:1615 stop:3057 length:1443 start_codon:yes stop_codon:yes gene_type:complete